MQGAHVVMAARDMATCRAAQAMLEGEKLPGTCACAQLDLEDGASGGKQRGGHTYKDEVPGIIVQSAPPAAQQGMLLATHPHPFSRSGCIFAIN